MKIEIKHRVTGTLIISGDFFSVKDCLEKNRGAYLGSADLRDITGYSQSHEIFTEIIRRQKVDLFVPAEWVVIAQITIYLLCWAAIQKRFGDVMPSIFTKLAGVGYPEWLEHWNELAN